MPNAGRTARALSVVTALGLAATISAQAHLVEDFGVRRGAPAHISLSTGFNGFVGAGIKKIQVDGVQMDAFCIDPFTMALRSSIGYKFVPLTKAPEAPFTLSASEAIEISDLWAMFYNPGMKENKAAGLQLAIWEIVGGDDFSVIGKDYGASLMLAALRTYSGPGAGLIALTGPGQDYVVLTPPGQGVESTPTPRPHSTPTPTPHSSSPPTSHSPPTSTPTLPLPLLLPLPLPLDSHSHFHTMPDSSPRPDPSPRPHPSPTQCSRWRFDILSVRFRDHGPPGD